MKCVLLEAKNYQAGFKNNLIFTGFEDGRIQWLGTDREFEEMEGSEEYPYGDMIEPYDIYRENLGD